MTTPAARRREIARTQKRLDRAAEIAKAAHDDLCAVFPPYSPDGGLRMDAARAADDAAAAARNFRANAARYQDPRQ